MAGAPILLGITAQALSVRLDNEFLRISAPNLDFLVGEPLARLRDGRNADYVAQLTVATGKERVLQARSVARFAFSYDIWLERYKVTLLIPGQEHPPESKNLTREAAQAWCLEQLKIDLAHVPADRPMWIRLEMRSEDPKETEGIIGEPGISLSGMIALFSHPPKKQQIRLVEEIGPYRIADLRKPRS